VPDLEGSYSGVLPVSPKEATEAILDVAAYPKWWRSVKTSLRKGVGGKAVVGSIIRVKHPEATFEYEVRSIEPGKRVEMECVGGSYRGPASWTFVEKENGTRATFHVSLDAESLVVQLLGKAVDANAVHREIVTSSLARLAELFTVKA
jgi:ribosome-associated toxin RatA of RatAB toxin-antitoxin module